MDVRLRRSVRAKGFNGEAFASTVGPRRYTWMPRLGNKRIASKSRRGPRIVIADPSAAAELLNLAIDAARERRRIIFFCACQFPKWKGRENCHRHRVATLLLREARRRQRSLEIVEWPGGIEASIERIEVLPRYVREVGKGRSRIPLGTGEAPSEWLARPQGTPVVLSAPIGSVGVFATYPVFSGGWQLPFVEPIADTMPARLRRVAVAVRRAHGFEPRRC